MGFFDIFSNGPAQDAANNKVNGLQIGYNAASKYYQKGRGALTQYGGRAIGPYQDILRQLGTTGNAGYQAYADATGANGAAGLAKAGQLFTSTPGYMEGINQALGQNDRLAASRGMLNSGNTIADTTKLATDYASQKYGQYVQGLSPYNNVPGQETAAANGYSGTLGGIASGLNSSFGNQGNLVYQTDVGIGNAYAGADLNNYNVSNNMWGGLMQGAKMLTGFL